MAQFHFKQAKSNLEDLFIQLRQAMGIAITEKLTTSELFVNSITQEHLTSMQVQHGNSHSPKFPSLYVYLSRLEDISSISNLFRFNYITTIAHMVHCPQWQMQYQVCHVQNSLLGRNQQH